MKLKKNILFLIMIAVMISAFAIFPEKAEAATNYFDFTNDKTGKTKYALNLRTGSSTSYKKITTIPKGASITVYGFVDKSSGDWYKVKYGTKTGYVAKEYVSISSSAFAENNISRPDSTVRKGKYFTVKGYIWGNYSLRYVKVGIKNSSNQWISGQYGIARPKTWYYNVGNLDSYVKFNELKPGTYYYTIYAENSQGTGVNIAKRSFTVKEASITGTNLSKPPSTKRRGSEFDVKGTVKSNFRMTYLHAGVYDSNGKKVDAAHEYVKPDALSYDVSRLNSYISFKSLKAGNYTYKVYAEDRTGYAKTLVSQPFTVKMITYDGVSVPKGNYKVGSYFTFKGKIYSYYKLGTVEVGVYDTNGKAVSNCYKKVSPNTYSYDISKVDASMYFNKLSKGSYRYKVYAKDTYGNYRTIVDQKFTVGMSDAVVGNPADISAFPASYQKYLKTLAEAHPNWTFEVINVGSTWEDAVNSEMTTVGKQLVSTSAPKAWKSTEKGAIDVDTGKYVVFDSGWNAANRKIVEYYMDPRNALSEATYDDQGYTKPNIYQFATHDFLNSCTVSNIKNAISNSFMALENGQYSETKASKYANYIYNAAKKLDANPYVLVSMIITEQGWKSTSPRVTGVGVDMTGAKINGVTQSGVKYKNIYNFYNIGAYKQSSTTMKVTATQRGLWYASLTDSGNLRPWNTPEKAIQGGAMFYVNNYVKKGQDTFYTKKFNVTGYDSNKDGDYTDSADYRKGTHEYSTNVQSAATEGSLLKTVCKNLDNEKLVFKIPVFKNMPESNCKKPS
ncbi:MAG: SH3 domain-containing protein [Eubacterium sp.]|nr:SH3 domain-containing protein [Eubacterium sp.]